MRPYLFRWPGLSAPAEDHPEPKLLPAHLRRPDWQKPAEPLDPCGTPAPPFKAKNSATRRDET